MVGRPMRCVLAFVLGGVLLCLGSATSGGAIELGTREYEVWCDCNGDGVADINKHVWLTVFDDIRTPGIACPACCCVLLSYKEITIQFDPLPLLPPPSGSPVTAPPPSPTASPAPGQIRATITVPYTHGEALVDVRLRKPSGTGWHLLREAIVDTGAGITLLPKAAATALALNLRSGQEISLRDVSGTSIPAWCHQIEVQFLDKQGNGLAPITILAAFVDRDDLPILIGRKDVLAAVEIVMGESDFRISTR